MTGPRAEPDFRALFEAAPTPFLVLDPEFVIVAVSDAYLTATMTAREGIVGHALFEIFPDNPDDAAANGVSTLRASLERVRASHSPDTMAVQRYDIRRPAGEGGGFETRWWSPVNTPVLDAAGELRWIIHRVEDVTEFVRLRDDERERERATEALRSGIAQAEAELLQRASDIAETNRELELANAELRRSQIFLDSVVENIPSAVFVKEAGSLRFVRFNKAEEELVGWARERVVGKTDFDIFPREQAEFFTSKDREALDGRTVVDVPEEPLDTPENGRRWLHTKKIPIVDEAGRPIYLLGISEDITERKRFEADLIAARQEAERANRAKTDFLSQMSHELRTPLTAILGFSQLLELDDLTDEQQSSVGHIMQAGRHLLDLINEILDISRIETGTMTISAEPVALDELIEEVFAVVQPIAATRTVMLKRGSSFDVHVLADRQRLRQVLLNLLTNALKYNRQGGTVVVSCEQAPDERLRIAIADTGYGIAPEHLERLFQPFDRLGAELGTIEGTGIGLALAQGLIGAMGGTIQVESILEVGTTFTIDLALTEGPLERYERLKGDTVAAPSDGPRRRVLQIEDNTSNVRLVERIMERRPDIELITAGGGRSGVELARSHLPDLVLLDLHLPDIPGHEVLRELRAHPATRHIPVIVVSADATKAQMTRLRDAGVFGYLTKPLDVGQLLATIDRAIHGDGQAASDKPGGTGQAPESG